MPVDSPAETGKTIPFSPARPGGRRADRPRLRRRPTAGTSESAMPSAARALGRDRGVGHDRRVLDQAFDAAEALGQGEELGSAPARAASRPGRGSGSPVIMPPKPRICRLASACCGWLARPGIDDALARRRAASSQRATASAFSQCRSMRSASVFRPRSARKLSNGPAIAPTAFCRKVSCSASSAFVAHHQPRRRPRRSGRSGTWWSSASRRRSRAPAAAGVGAGEGVVGDGQDAALAAPIRARASRSASRSSGLVGVSTQISAVSGLIAASTRRAGRSGRRS